MSKPPSPELPPPRTVTWRCSLCSQDITRLISAQTRAAVCPHCRKRSAVPDSLIYRLRGEPQLPGFEELRER